MPERAQASLEASALLLQRFTRALERYRRESDDAAERDLAEQVEVSRDEQDPERQAFASELGKLVEAAVDTLPDGAREVFMLRDEVLPIVRMRELVQHPGAAPDALEQVIVVEMAERRAALVVDALVGQQEIVVKQFDGVRDGLGVFGGATILGDGVPALIFDVSSLL